MPLPSHRWDKPALASSRQRLSDLIETERLQVLAGADFRTGNGSRNAKIGGDQQKMALPSMLGGPVVRPFRQAKPRPLSSAAGVSVTPVAWRDFLARSRTARPRQKIWNRRADGELISCQRRTPLPVPPAVGHI